MIIAFWFLIAVILIFLFSRTPAGRLSNAVRDNEERVEFIGYSMRSVRYLVFIGAGFFAGVAGGMSALAFESTTQSDLSNFYSGVALMAVFVGGAGFFIGPILGALIYQFFAQVLPSTLYELYLGIIFLVMVMFAPQGVAGIILMHIAFVKRLAKIAHTVRRSHNRNDGGGLWLGCDRRNDAPRANFRCQRPECTPAGLVLDRHQLGL